MKTKFDFNIRKDLWAFIDYVDSRGLKRSHRENAIMKADLKRLSKLLTIPEFLAEIETEDGYWSEFICALARWLKLLTYDTEGVYAGYTSSEPSFPDNYVEIKHAAVTEFKALSNSDRERRILEALIANQPKEYYYSSLLGISSGRFDRRGSGVNIAAKMNYTVIRKRLLHILAEFEPEKSVPFTELIQKVKSRERNLILDPKFKPKKKAAPPSWSKDERDSDQLYYCFYESPKGEYHRTEIHESQSDSFERVEGRYLAYFLEQIPLLMQFVHIEYDPDFKCDISPQLPYYIKSFSVTKKLAPILDQKSRELDHVKITLTPDYKIFVEAALYPDSVLEQLEPYTVIESSDNFLTVLKLNKKKAVASLAEDHQLAPVDEVLTKMKVALPKNVQAELHDWSKSADKFVIYEDVGLLECAGVAAKEREKVLDSLRVMVIDRGNDVFAILTEPRKVCDQLQAGELVPSFINHAPNRIVIGSAKKIVEEKPEQTPKKYPKVSIKEQTFTALQISNKKALAHLTEYLRSLNVEPLILDSKAGFLFFPETYRSKLNSALRKLKKDHEVTLV